MPLDKSIKTEVIKEFQRESNDTGSPEIQIAILSKRIEQLTEHLRERERVPDCWLVMAPIKKGRIDWMVEKACELAKECGAKRALPLPVAGAYHSRLMESACPKLETVLREVDLNLPAVPVVSNVTAQPHATAGEILQRLVEQVTSPVRWEASIRHLLNEGFTRFIELGPGTALTGFMRRIDRETEVLNVADLESLGKTVAALSA